MADRVLDTRTRLTDTHHLFKESEDPFDPDYEASGTLEQIANELYAHTTYRSVRLTLELPPSAVTDDVAARLHSAIDRYCDRHRLPIPDDPRQLKRELRWTRLMLAAVPDLGCSNRWAVEWRERIANRLRGRVRQRATPERPVLSPLSAGARRRWVL